jgi:Phage tail sheath C-terminal domain
MARPNVNFKINDESMVVPISEQFSSSIGGVYNPTIYLKILGTTGERNASFYFVPNLSDWYARLNDYIIKQAGGVVTAQSADYTPGACAASILNGEYIGTGYSAGFSAEWWGVHNFLQYGGGCYVGFGFSFSGITAFYDLGFDVIFQGASGSNYATAVTSIVDNLASTDRPAIGVVNVPSSPEAITSASATSAIPTGTSAKEYVRVYGEKQHLDTSGLVTVTTPLAPDIAGCIVRTDRDSYPWFSPAGPRRGRILNVLRLNRVVNSTEQDILYGLSVNPVVTYLGDGTLLFGDKTGTSETSSLSRINVSRLFMYIKRALGPVARSVLFEQNDSITRSRFKIAAEGFLDRIVAQRGISEYKVICDTTNNTPEVVEANYFVADILIKPITSINYVTITLTNKDLSSTL